MAIRHAHLPEVLQFKKIPNASTVAGILVSASGPFPTDTQLQQWIDEYEALPPDGPEKDPKGERIRRAQGANSIAALRALVIELLEER